MKRAAGPFEILEILGEGSFGTVCVARVQGDPRKRKVALKILKGAYTRNPKILNRTRDEARLLAHINHPNVVRVERLIDIGDRPVVVMELVEGVSLDQLLLRFKQGVPAAVAIEVTRQTLIALHVAYYEATGPDGRPLKVIHRDIKPSNILLSVRGELKVVDFGIAKGDFSGREAETESVVLGSRPYMAPERLDGVSDHPTVDVYSAGMSLYELLTGRTMSLSINPVTHEQAMNRQLGYLNVEGMMESGLEDLRGIVRRMCAYDRDYRPSALEAARELEQCLYAIDARFRLGLEEFSRTTVLPIYESRPRIRPEDAVQDESESEFIREVTGQVTSPTITASPGARWTPYVFVTVLSVLVAVLSTLAVVKFLSDAPGAVATPPAPDVTNPVVDEAPPEPVPAPAPAPAPAPQPAVAMVTGPAASAEQAGAAASGPDIAAVQAVLTEPEPVQVEPTVDPVETDPQPAVAMVEVEFHPPPGATALVGGKTMVQAGYVQLPEGPNTASITFRNRRRIVCEFNAVNAGIVRLVEELDNNLSLHVTGEPSPVCQDVE